MTKLLIMSDFHSPTDHYYGEALSGEGGHRIKQFLGKNDFILSDLRTLALFPFKEPFKPFIARTRGRNIDWVRTPIGWMEPSKMGYLAKFLTSMDELSPDVIVPVGNYSFSLLGGEGALIVWRGSELKTSTGIRMIPTVPLSMWNMRPDLWPVIERDLLRAITPPPITKRGDHLINPSYRQVMHYLSDLSDMLVDSDKGERWLSLDLETASNHITCLGLQLLDWGPTICIPFTTNGLLIPKWTSEEEEAIIMKLKYVLTHPRLKILGQNLFYDFQMIAHHWLFIPNFGYDTMLAHHVFYPWLEKSLAFQASIYNDNYTYWKEMHKAPHKEGKED